MYSTTATLLVLQCTLCFSIRVPVAWNDDNSEVNDNKQFAVETNQPQNVVKNNVKPIPTEYFAYTAQKPKFAVEIARYHGVQSPENHYKAYPIKPYTGVPKPELGKHHLLDNEKNIFRPYQQYVKKSESERYITPSTTSYEVFHPYKLEEPALKELYQDPVMDKIRNDLENSKNRLQKHENDAGEPNITKDEYLESFEETDRKKVPQRNIPAPYEIHRPQRRPVYYRPPIIPNQREHVLNQKFRQPWHQNYIKVKPIHYRPVKNHLHRLRQQHALKYDDEHNEYPQVLTAEKYNEPSDGDDIYEKGKAKFVQLRNNVDESINEAIQNNRPIIHQKLELNNESDEKTNSEDKEEEFVPIKNYAQVRRTDTTKYLPKSAAFHDADTLDEIQNAPRLREAIKSTKAQTVYSEEGYEDSAYDHAGEQKHASDHEGHGGFLKEKENSEGKYKTPSFSAKFKDGGGSEHHDQVLDNKKWKDNKKDTEEEKESEEYSENEQEQYDDSDIYSQKPSSNTDIKSEKLKDSNNNNSPSEEKERTKRAKTIDDTSNTKTVSEKPNNEHDVNKREAKIIIPEFKLNSTYRTEIKKLNLPKLSVLPKVNNVDKYPYYLKKIKAISKNSPLRYAENLKLIPKKSEGGTEFYDSKAKLECPEVEDNVDPIPEKLKKGGHPDEDEESVEDDDDADEQKKPKSDFSILEKKPHLRGLGDKIDCFKVKYFGENPLDSPFFEEEIISNPEPLKVPNADIYKLKQRNEKSAQELKLNKTLNSSEQLKDTLNTLHPKHNSKVTNDNVIFILPKSDSHVDSRHPQNISDTIVQSKENLKKQPFTLRKKRAAPFVYEPYKIIKDSQIQDSKKTTTTNNISPLIKQLQSSRVVERVITNQGKDQIVKRNAGTRTYKDIGKNDRGKTKSKGSKPVYNTTFVDVSVDQRRGEPRYELRLDNHKSEYTPVANKTSISKEDYKAQTNSNINTADNDLINNKKQSSRRRRTTTTTTTTIRPYFDVSKFLPHPEEFEKINLSETKITPQKQLKPQFSSNKPLDDGEDYDEYDDKDIEYTTTTTTTKPRRRTTYTSTTVKIESNDNGKVTEAPKLRLVTRFRDSYPTEDPIALLHTENPTTKVKDDDDEITSPKYREKKKKSSKSTLVTDTKSYGEEDDDDLGKEEVDALIGIKQDIKEYMPLYEKKAQKKNSTTETHSESQDDDNNDNDYEEDDQDHDEEDDEYEDEETDDDDELAEEDDEEDESEELEAEVTTAEPTKRTLVKTTEAPISTTEARSAKLEIKPIVLKKKIEIHKELPVNRSSPHVTEFKQDIKEVEIIKEIPSNMKKKPQKDIEVLELYKDENLAKDINKLGGVEIFKEGLDLANGPKHGGNYRSAEVHTDKSISPSLTPVQKHVPSKGDIVTSQSKTSKLIEIKDDPSSSRRRDFQRARNNRGRSAKLIELSESTDRPTPRTMHGGNFKSIHDDRRRGGNRNAKIIELDDDNSSDEQSTNTNSGDFNSFGSRNGDRHRMHGGNYRSAKIVQAKNIENKLAFQSENVNRKDKIKDGRRNAAVFLSSFASAVPVLATTPAYILDPSKRMYYYVEA